MTDGERAPLWVRALAYAMAALMAVGALALVGSLAVYALRLLVTGIMALAQMAAGGVAV